MKYLLLTYILLTSCFAANARLANRNVFGRVDSTVKKVGPMHGAMLKQIVDAITPGSYNETERLRALYVWVAQNISYDCHAHNHPKQSNNSASATFINRKASYEGYVNLFKTMCGLAQIKCEIVNGFAKHNPEDIGKITEKNAHAWNAVYLDNEWYLVDVTWGAGYTDKKVKNFKPFFTDAWFMADKELFSLGHFPLNKKWQMLDTPFNRSVFNASPIIGPAAIVNEVYPIVMRGQIRGRADTSKKVAFELDNPPLIQSVSVGYKYRKVAPVKYTIEDNILYVDVPFEKAGKYPVNIYINDALAYIYNATVAEAIKKRKPKPAPVVPIKRGGTSRSSG